MYILSNYSDTLYGGMTNDLERRMTEHKSKEVSGFTKKYNVTKLVYVETTSDVSAAIERERQIKSWRRSKKIALVEEMNPRWRDLTVDWR